MQTPEFPTPWQQKTIWAAVTTLAVVSIGWVAVRLIALLSTVLGFLQPILFPFALAGVMAYLLEPVVARIVLWGTSRQRAVLSVFAVVTLLLAGILVWIIPAIWTETANLVRKVPTYRERVTQKVEQFNGWAHSLEQKYGVKVLPQIPEKIDNPLAGTETAGPAGAEASGTQTTPASSNPPPETPANGAVANVKEPAALDLQSFDWIRRTLPTVLRSTWKFVTNSVGGFLGVFGFLLSMVIVPIYLYYFLIESKNIAASWGDYLPLRASSFKDEVVAAISEINGYLIAFFRGQLLVSVINGTATGILLFSVGLDFGLLIGLILCILGVIPYLGIIICWVPAVIIASVQGGGGTWIPGEPWWIFPLVVTGIFTVVQQIDGLFVTPKVVGESVGLHPMTVIVSVFAWTLLMGGLLGAILAVPMTATIKVLLKRYVWQRKLRADAELAVTEDTLPMMAAQAAARIETAAR
ncbi:MAG TPA: AI-2E family transporter [Chthoniobacteraceae bacterium]|jgi:predicted PurR-regulated permease PerM